MSYEIWQTDQLCPIGILLASSGSGGNKLLFKYPNHLQQSLYELFEAEIRRNEQSKKDVLITTNSDSIDPFLIGQNNEDLAIRSTSEQESIDIFDHLVPLSYIENDKLSPELKDEILVNLLVGRCDSETERFFLKLEDVIFIGHCAHHDKFSIVESDPKRTIKYFNVVFALKSTVPENIQQHYYILAKSISSVICFEEKRTHFLSTEKENIQSIMDDLQENSDNGIDPLEQLCKSSRMCQDLKKMVDDVAKTGMVNSSMNGIANVHYGIPQRIFHVIDIIYVKDSDIIEQANNIKPYHTLLYLKPINEIYESVRDPNPNFLKFMKAISLTRNIHAAMIESRLKMPFCLRLARILVQWGQAITCYPIAPGNRYWLAPYSHILLDTVAVADFHKKFPNLFLPNVLQEFTRYLCLRDVLSKLGLEFGTSQSDSVIEWLLRHRIIYQVHNYYMVLGRELDQTANLDCYATLPDNLFVDDVVRIRFNQVLSEYSISSACIEIDCCAGEFDMTSVELLAKLIPLCNGKNHLEALYYYFCSATHSPCDTIMDGFNYKGGIIERLLNRLPGLFIRVECPDPVTACFAGLK